MKTLLFPLPTEISDIKYASGSFHSIHKSLSKVFNIVTVGPLKLKKNLFHSALNRLNDYNLFPFRFATMHSWLTVNYYGKQIQNLINDIEFDAIFATSTLHAAAVKTGKPVFAYTDLSYTNALDYQGFASAIYPTSKMEALAVDKYCFEKYTKVFLASEWAKNETIKAYGLPKDKVIAIGRGANFTSNFKVEDLEYAIEMRIRSTKKYFLFIGNNWQRKGGDVAFQIVKKFYEKSKDVKLQIVGCIPPKNVRTYPFIEFFPYLDRENENDNIIYRKLFTEAFLFLMPTKVDAMGISFNEASSFGLPSIAYNTGGVGAAIENNTTGLLFNLNDSIEMMTERIFELMNNIPLYKSYSLNAFNKHRNENNWETIALKIKDIIEPII